MHTRNIEEKVTKIKNITRFQKMHKLSLHGKFSVKDGNKEPSLRATKDIFGASINKQTKKTNYSSRNQ